jgi:hypothetical protein
VVREAVHDRNGYAWPLNLTLIHSPSSRPTPTNVRPPRRLYQERIAWAMSSGDHFSSTRYENPKPSTLTPVPASAACVAASRSRYWST